MNFGYVYVMIFVLKKIYVNDKEGLKKVLKRYFEFFNMIFYIVILMFGIFFVMEKENFELENFDENFINNIKIVLMGFFFGIGDFFFWGILRFLVIGIGIVFFL